MFFGRFYLDKEKDIIIDLDLNNNQMTYVLYTPNHSTGNLINNLARLCQLEAAEDGQGRKVIKDTIPAYIDGNNRKLWIMRLADTKVANIYPDGKIERKAMIPAIAKVLMSETKEYHLDAGRTLVKTYIREECKFHSDLHTHMNANLSGDILIALGIFHQLRYPYYYIKKLGLVLTAGQLQALEEQRKTVTEKFRNSSLKGKYLRRRIDDNTFINFADLILNNIENSEENIRRIRASLAVMKDGQAVFTNLEKVYLYRYVFTRGFPSEKKIELKKIEEIPDGDIIQYLMQMQKDHQGAYFRNSLYQDELLWIARSYAGTGITYAEISDTNLAKKDKAPAVLKEIHDVMPQITRDTGVTLRFLVALRRIPLTIVKDAIETNYFTENLQVLKAVSVDPYVAGSDIVGEEMNDIREIRPVIAAIVQIAGDDPEFVIRIHAGENDSLPDNVANSIACVKGSLKEGQPFPHMRIGHGLYTANLHSQKGKELIQSIKENDVVLEFQITSNVRLNNLTSLDHHPLKDYLQAGLKCVQGTDGGALYGTDSIDEQLSLERMLHLSYAEMCQMREAEKAVVASSLAAFEKKEDQFHLICRQDIVSFYRARIDQEQSSFANIQSGIRKFRSSEVLAGKIASLPSDRIPIVIIGGSFNNMTHTTKTRKEEISFLEDLIKKADPQKYFFVTGPVLKAYEEILIRENNKGFRIFAYVPSLITGREEKKLQKTPVSVRPSLESSLNGVYKSISYEIFKQRQSVIIAFDGNSSAANLIQDARNSKYKSRTFISIHSRSLKQKAEALEGYITFFHDGDNADEVMKYAEKYYHNLNDPNAQILKRNRKINL